MCSKQGAILLHCTDNVKEEGKKMNKKNKRGDIVHRDSVSVCVCVSALDTDDSASAKLKKRSDRRGERTHSVHQHHRETVQ